MGLFDKFFGDKKQPEKENPIQYTEDWDTYFTNVDHQLGSIMVDLGIRKIAPVAEKPVLIWVSVKMNDPRADGLSSNEESEKLYEIEDHLTGQLKNKFDSIYIGRLTSNGSRDLYFYFDNQFLYDKTIADVMINYPNYEYDFGTKEDPHWSVYLDFLYPLPAQLQTMHNRKVLMNLESHGDDHHKPRQVDHYLYFNTEDDRENFVASIEDSGFTVRNKDTKADGDYRYMLHLTILDPVDYDSINERTINLAESAANFNGTYDGWGCPIVK
ncbi:DUF695 domain-containing protein [Pedobacter punctiformis]|uniref:DUF695 domain-containing protein n=1 Tax=Pedobacter punctiformis TaxID=3004097 RepID=A0ABT4LDB1_9SPHI|nr:DUF695 domain-containing protein [Pedobacter sp. HCMS5-2]MCZ4245893.1 DUF695 domain-containing protein [Pedobacter sp. HCMS5-2]